MPNTLDSRYVSGPKNELATKDVHEVQENRPISTSSGADNGSTSMLAGDVNVPEGDKVEFDSEGNIVESSTSPNTNIKPNIENNANPHVSQTKIIKGVTTEVTAPKEGVKPPKKPSLKDKTIVNAKRLEKEVAKLPKDMRELVMEGLDDPKQQDMFTKGMGLLDNSTSKVNLGNFLAGWVLASANDLPLNKQCALLAIAAGSLLGLKGLDKLAALLVLLALLAKLIECFIIEPINRLLKEINDPRLTEMVAVFTMGKVLNPMNEKKKSVEESYKEEANPSTKNVTSKRLQPTQQSTSSNNPEKTAKSKEYASVYNGEGATRNSPLGRIEDQPGVREGTILPPETEGGRHRGADLDLFKTLLEYTSPEVVKDAYPNITSNLLFYYRLPRFREWSIEEEYNTLVGLITILEPGWDKTTRNGEEISNLRHFAGASKDSLYILSSYKHSAYKSEALIAKSYIRNDINRLLIAQYPNIAL
ncbi:MAG: hypothetical protein IBX57_01090 [Gammaproteobacteria bacterium]|nr:hypothetical protein [Gammaproteobacteria bacterium]